MRSLWLTAVLGAVLAAGAAAAQTRPPAPRPPAPYKSVAVVLPKPVDDPIFAAFRKELAGAGAKTLRLPKADQYQLQAEAFSRAVAGKEKLAYGVEDAILQMRVIDALFRSEKSGNWEKP